MKKVFTQCTEGPYSMAKRIEKKTEKELMQEYIASDPELWGELMAILQSGLDAYEVWKANPTPENEKLLDATDVALDAFEQEHDDFISRDPRRSPAPPGYYVNREEERKAGQGDEKVTEKY